jgi:hypothetical protein
MPIRSIADAKKLADYHPAKDSEISAATTGVGTCAVGVTCLTIWQDHARDSTTRPCG